MLWTAAFYLVIGVLLPIGAWFSRPKPSAAPPTDAELPSMPALAWQACIVHAVTFGLAWMAASASGADIPWRPKWVTGAILVSIVVLILGLAMAWLESKRPPDPHNAVGRVLARAKLFDPALLAMLLSAGIAEEFVYRGVLSSLLTTHLGGVLAAVASALLFGLGHVAQGWRGFVASFCFALAMQCVVWLSGGLLLAMASHLAYDFSAIWLSHVFDNQRAQRAKETTSDC